MDINSNTGTTPGRQRPWHTYVPTSAHASHDVLLTCQIDRIRFARCIVDHGPEIVDDWHGLLAAVCRRELHARGLLIDVPAQVSEHLVGQVVTHRGREYVHNLTFSWASGSALIRLCVQEFEFWVHPTIDDEEWADLARSLLEFELNLDDPDVTITERHDALDIEVQFEGDTWNAMGVKKDVGSIAKAIVDMTSSSGPY